MDKSRLIKYGAIATVTAGMGLTLPMLAPVVAPVIATLITGFYSKELSEKISEEGVKAIGGILGNLGASHLWETRSYLEKSPENQDLLRLLANAYLEAIKEFEAGEEAENILPLVEKRIKRAIDTKKADDLLMLFPLDKNSKEGDLKYSFANRLSSGDLILKMADETFSEGEIFADDIEISLRRWLTEEKNAAANKDSGFTSLNLSTSEQLPEPLCSELREQLSNSIPKKIGELVKKVEFNPSWIAFQRLHLQAILKEVNNKQNGLSDKDRELLKPLAENLDRLSKLDGVPEEIAKLSEDMMFHFDNLETNIKENQTALLKTIADSEERVVREVINQSKEIKKKISEGNISLEEINVRLDNLQQRVESLSDNFVNSTVLQTLVEEIKNLKETANLAEKSLPNNIPPSIENFVGRDEYLNGLFELYQKGARCFVLHGIGGVGKTEIAKRFIEKIADEYEAKIYVEMFGVSENPYSAERAMFEVVRKFEPKISADISYEQLKGIFVQFVQQQPTLIFLDNAENKSAVEDLKQAKVCLIATSREAFTLTDKDGGKHIGMMTETDARNLLYEIAGVERFADGEADELARLTGYLPMALRPPAALLAEDEFETAGNLITRYRDKQNLLAETVPDYYDRKIAASFELSYQKLSTEMQTRWRNLSIFPSDFDEAAIAAILNISAEEATETQKNLRRLSLLDGNSETRRFSLHDLVREYARAKLDTDENFQTSFLFARHYALILLRAQIMQENREENYYVKALKLIDTEWDNITAGQKWVAQFLEQENRIAYLCMKYSGYARDFILLRLNFSKDIEWLEFGLRATQKLKNSLEEGNRLTSLGIAYKNLGNFRKSIDYLEQSLIIHQETNSRLSEGAALDNLGLAYLELGNFQKAIECHKQSLVISLEFDHDLGKGKSLNNLGNSYFRLRDYRKAVEYYELSLQIKRKLDDRLGEGNSLGNLSIIYMNLGDYRKAVEYNEQSLNIFRELNDRLGESKSLGNLGNVYITLGDYKKAIEYHEQSLVISREMENRLGEAQDLCNLGGAYWGIGERQAACDFWKKSLAIFEAIESPFAEVVRQWIAEDCGGDD